MRFKDKVVLITGASSGIGADAARAFAKEGAHVFLAARREDRGEQVAQEIRQEGGSATFYKADMAKRSDIANMVAACVQTYGKLDIAFNNAGIEGDFFVESHLHSEEAWDQTLAVNLTGVWLCMRHQIPEMLKHGKGAIVNMASMAGVKGFPGSSGYAASKFGVVGITKAAALEYIQQGIRINCVCPAVIRSEMAEKIFLTSEESSTATAASHPIGRIGEAREITNAVMWLASDEASFVVGEALQVDGGLGA
jgi:NAD(P)-dependent dehydrogenase (short-subunit alcohol dehydrogenase family)